MMAQRSGVLCLFRTEEPVEEPQEEEEKKMKKKKSEEQISKYRELLKGIQDKEKKLQEDKDMEMEITWVPGTRTHLNWVL